MSSATTRRPSKPKGNKTFSFFLFSPQTGWIVLGVSLVLTALAWSYSARYLEQRAQIQFDAQVERIESAIKLRMQQYARMLEAGVGFFDSSDEVTRYEWQKFIAAFDLPNNYPGTQGIGISVPVRPEDVEKHEAAMRKEGFPTYKINPSGKRPLYTAITYLEPLDWRNLRAIGYDMYSEHNRRAAMDTAINTGKPAISGVVKLKQETDENVQSGFLMYLPVYNESMISNPTIAQRRENFRTMVYAVLRATDLMQNLLAPIGDDVSLRLYDTDINTRSLLYKSDADDEMDGYKESRFFATRTIPIFGHRWNIEVNSRDSTNANLDYWQSTAVGLGGLLVDIMLFYIIHLAARRGREIERELYTRKLERSNDDLERFAHAAAHDLKSPLRAIDNLSSWIAKDNAEILPDQSKRHLQLLQSRSRRLERLLDDLLAYSRIDADDNRLETIDLAELCNEVVDLLSIPGAFDIRVAEAVPTVISHRSPLRQVLMNLVSNAMKHHDREHGLVMIDFGWRGTLLECTVSDDGPGVPEQFRERAFDMFATLDSKDNKDTSGIGLSMVLKLVTTHGGVISLEDNEHSPRGLKVRFTWEAEFVSEGQASASTDVTPPTPRKASAEVDAD